MAVFFWYLINRDLLQQRTLESLSTCRYQNDTAMFIWSVCNYIFYHAQINPIRPLVLLEGSQAKTILVYTFHSFEGRRVFTVYESRFTDLTNHLLFLELEARKQRGFFCFDIQLVSQLVNQLARICLEARYLPSNPLSQTYIFCY